MALSPHRSLVSYVTLPSPCAKAQGGDMTGPGPQPVNGREQRRRKPLWAGGSPGLHVRSGLGCTSQDFNEEKIEWGEAGGSPGATPPRSWFLISPQKQVTLGVQPHHVLEDRLCRSDKGVLGPTYGPTDMLPVHGALHSHPSQRPFSVPDSTRALCINEGPSTILCLTVERDRAMNSDHERGQRQGLSSRGPAFSFVVLT